MLLYTALIKANSYEDLNEVFSAKTEVKLCSFNDEVKVQGYEGAVSTDFLAQTISSLAHRINSDTPETEEGKKLAKALAEKVFIPLSGLVDSPKNACSLYQLVALKRIGWTPPQASDFGTSIALKHAMVLGYLDLRYRFGW